MPSHGRGHWFDPSTAHQINQLVTPNNRPENLKYLRIWDNSGTLANDISPSVTRRLYGYPGKTW